MAPRNDYGSIPLAAGDSKDSADETTTGGGGGGGGGSGAPASLDVSFDDRNGKSGGKAYGVVSLVKNNKKNLFFGLVALGVIIATSLCLSPRRSGSHYHNGGGIHTSTGASSPSSSSAKTTFLVDPHKDLGFHEVERSGEQAPGKAWGTKLVKSGKPLPTNNWYLNLLPHSKPSESNRVYTVPYIVDTVGPIPGVRLHWPTMRTNARNAQMVVDAVNGFTLGGIVSSSTTSTTGNEGTVGVAREYTLVHHNQKYDKDLSPLGLSLRWTTASSSSSSSATSSDDETMKNKTTSSTGASSMLESGSGSSVEATLVRGASSKASDATSTSDDDSSTASTMTSHIVRGQPYGTMEYTGDIVPAIASANVLASSPLVDGKTSLHCEPMMTKNHGSSSSSSNGPNPTSAAAPAASAGTEETRGLNSSSSSSSSSSFSGGEKGASSAVVAKREVVIHFKDSDFTWAVFFSRPVQVSCQAIDPEAYGPGFLSTKMFQMVATPVDGESKEPLVVRTALVNECTTGHSDIQAHCLPGRDMKDADGYLDLLRKHVGNYPRHPTLGINYTISSSSGDKENQDGEASRITFDWDVQKFPSSSNSSSSSSSSSSDSEHRNLRANSTVASTNASHSLLLDDSSWGSSDELLMFAMPHHQAQLEDSKGGKVLTDYCKPTFHGSSCIVRGNKWSLIEKLGAPQSFIGERPPEASAIPDLAKSLATDIKYKLADNMHVAAADTYFSGKVLAKLGRIITIAAEMQQLASSTSSLSRDNERTVVLGDYDTSVLKTERYTQSAQAAKKAKLPSPEDISDAVEELKKGVEVWLNGKGEAEYLYDASWGGLVNCGCNYSSNSSDGHCNNTFPDCPALTDVNVDFGNAFYNDHHYHYGYHVYAAAVVAKFDPAWGQKYFDHIMLYIRDFANPQPSDPFFPQYRQKDWFLGSSWASGIISANEPHGRNQESSSEAIAAYEAMTLYGSAMVDAFGNDEADSSAGPSRASDAKEIRDAGRLLTAMEVSATHRYWHVWNSTSHVNTYPSGYKEAVVGMLYETMASFQTWFGGGDLVSYGIQLLPFTPVTERRDNPEWVKLVYPQYEKSCSAEEKFCVENGWKILLSGLKATIGKRDEAVKDALDIPARIFLSQGACGHSLSNTIWYASTRPDVNFTAPEESTVGAEPTVVGSDASSTEEAETTVVESSITSP